MKQIIHDWTTYWTIFFIVFMVALVIPDWIAVIIGHRDHVGDSFTFTHWLVTKLGLSVIGAVIGYLVVHFLIVHHSG